MKRTMPIARANRPNVAVEWELRPRAIEVWTPGLMAAAGNDAPNTISIFDPIGVDFWTGEGVTARRIAAALRSIGADTDVTVYMNSPGGDIFEGIAIYNLFREHKGKVTMKVLALAASAASIIAMAGDEVQIARAGFLMIHNTWVVALGNRIELREIADYLEPFDAAMADIYQARTGIELNYIKKKMDAETWINGSAAVEEGWADALLPADEVTEDKDRTKARASAQALDAALVKAGLSRQARHHLLTDFRTGALADGVRGNEVFGRAAPNDAQLPEEHDMSGASNGAAPAANAAVNTQEQLDAARQAGVTEGQATATAAVVAAKVRIKAIKGLEAAKDRPLLAERLAMDTDMTPEAAQEFMAALPKEVAPSANAGAPPNLLAAAMAGVPNPKVGAQGEGDEEDAVAVGKRMAARVNKPRLVK